MMDESKLDETELPPKSTFYNRLVGQELDNVQYEHSKQLWMKRGMMTLRDWHHFYPAQRALSCRRLPGLQTHDDRLAQTRLPPLPQSTQHDAVTHAEVDRGR